MSRFKDGGEVIVPVYLQFIGIVSAACKKINEGCKGKRAKLRRRNSERHPEQEHETT